VLHQIGTGSLGPVFRGSDPQRRDPVAIKVLRIPLTPQQRARVVDDLRTLAARVPNHLALARPLDAGIADETCYVVSWLAPGEALDVALTEYGPAAIGDAIPRLRRVADALDLAETKGVWHGALHPRDILVSAEDTVVVGIGVAPILERAGVRAVVRAPYTAPEVAAGAGTSPLADQFALAAIAYEWMFGRAIAGPADAPLAIPSLPGVDPDRLADAFNRALAARSADRFASHGEFVDAIAGSLVDAAPAPVPDPRVIELASRRSKDTLVAAPPLALDDDDTVNEPAASAAIRYDDQFVEAEPVVSPAAPETSIADLRVDPEPPTLPTQPGVTPPAAHVEREPFTSIAHEREEHKAYGPAALLAMLLLGLAVGGAGGYFVASATLDRPPATPAMMAAAPTFTDAPLVAPDTPAPTRRSAAPAVAEAPALAPAPPPTPSPERAPAAAPARAPVRAPAPPPARAAAPRTGTATRGGPATRGSLVVQSRPAGARVSINGRSSGVTPLTVATLPAGAHRVRIERPGYQPWMTTVRVAPGGRARVGASLVGEHERE
jgi:hypothetical protein